MSFPLTNTVDQLDAAWQALTGFVLSRTTPELSSLFLAALALPVLLMTLSGRWSPFSTSPSSDRTAPYIRDSDYSYITSDQVRRGDYDGLVDADRSTDSLTLRHKGDAYVVHFAVHSIDREELTVGSLRRQAAKKIEKSGGVPGRVVLSHKGKQLKRDDTSCRAEGIRQADEIVCTIVERSYSNAPDEISSDEEITSETPPRRKKKSHKSKGKSKKAHDAPQFIADVLPVPSGNVSRSVSPLQAVKPPPKTPVERLDAAREALDDLRTKCNAFKSDPPADITKRASEHKGLGESILTQVLLKLDAVETDDPGLRSRRKEMVHQAQAQLKDLDNFMRQ